MVELIFLCMIHIEMGHGVMYDRNFCVHQVKQEAVVLYSRLAELQEKKNEIIMQNQQRGTPKEEREKLLRQVSQIPHKEALVEVENVFCAMI